MKKQKQQAKAATKKYRIHPVHKRIAVHATSVLFVLGGFVLPAPLRIHADTVTLDVTAKVAAAALTDPAVITSPTDQQHVADPNIQVSGTCPAQSYVIVFRNGVSAGVSDCTANSFTVPVVLEAGANSLQAKVYNMTDDEGPASPPITVFYDPPQTPTTPATPAAPPGAPTTGGASPGGVPDLTADIPYTHTVHRPGETWEWTVTINGGVPPYDVFIEWGDGQTTHITRPDRSPFTISHAYTQAGLYHPLVRITDSEGRVTIFQLIADVQEKVWVGVQFMRSLFANMSPWVAWPLYAVGIAAISLFWVMEFAVLRKFIVKLFRLKGHGRRG